MISLFSNSFFFCFANAIDFKMKLQWLSMSQIQEKNFADYRERKCQIEKDVKRTDRTQEYFAGDDNPNLGVLQDILMTYVMYNFDLGYVQGMSDLLAPILCIMNNEVITLLNYLIYVLRKIPLIDQNINNIFYSFPFYSQMHSGALLDLWILCIRISIWIKRE